MHVGHERVSVPGEMRQLIAVVTKGTPYEMGSPTSVIAARSLARGSSFVEPSGLRMTLVSLP